MGSPRGDRGLYSAPRRGGRPRYASEIRPSGVTHRATRWVVSLIAEHTVMQVPLEIALKNLAGSTAISFPLFLFTKCLNVAGRGTRTLYSPLSTLHSPLSTLHSPLSTLHSLLSTLYSPLSTLHSLLSTLYSPLSTLYSPLSTLHSLLSTLYSPLSTLYSPLCRSSPQKRGSGSSGGRNGRGFLPSRAGALWRRPLRGGLPRPSPGRRTVSAGASTAAAERPAPSPTAWGQRSSGTHRPHSTVSASSRPTTTSTRVIPRRSRRDIFSILPKGPICMIDSGHKDTKKSGRQAHATIDFSRVVPKK